VRGPVFGPPLYIHTYIHHLINLPNEPLEAEKLAVSRRTEMRMHFSLRWMPSLEALLSHASLNCAVGADASSSKSKHFSNYHCLEKDALWMKLHSVLLQFFTIGFSVGTEGLNCDCSKCA
jgi:hypothetical protein